MDHIDKIKKGEVLKGTLCLHVPSRVAASNTMYEQGMGSDWDAVVRSLVCRWEVGRGPCRERCYY
jgi:hypothetical protein